MTNYNEYNADSIENNTSVLNKNLSKECKPEVRLVLENNVYILSKKDIKIKYQIKNINNYEVSIGEGFFLDYWNNKNWVKYPITMNVRSYAIIISINNSVDLERTLPFN
ncbi:MAG: hypothetical protein Q4G63_13080, partial [Bacteroidia bacterium]|nr:hypothetical protein [Bacteroidia bacterium]